MGRQSQNVWLKVTFQQMLPIVIRAYNSKVAYYIKHYSKL